MYSQRFESTVHLFLLLLFEKNDVIGSQINFVSLITISPASQFHFMANIPPNGLAAARKLQKNLAQLCTDDWPFHSLYCVRATLVKGFRLDRLS